jgi:hypothetical protein
MNTRTDGEESMMSLLDNSDLRGTNEASLREPTAVLGKSGGTDKTRQNEV